MSFSEVDTFNCNNMSSFGQLIKDAKNQVQTDTRVMISEDTNTLQITDTQEILQTS